MDDNLLSLYVTALAELHLAQECADTAAVARILSALPVRTRVSIARNVVHASDLALTVLAQDAEAAVRAAAAGNDQVYFVADHVLLALCRDLAPVAASLAANRLIGGDEVLQEALAHHPDATVRLAVLRNEPVLPVVRLLLSDADPEIRDVAASKWHQLSAGTDN